MAKKALIIKAAAKPKFAVRAYTRRPGLDTRLMPARLRSRFWPYFSSTTSRLPTAPSSGSSTDHAAM